MNTLNATHACWPIFHLFFSVFDVLFFHEIRSQREMCVIRIQLQLAAEKKLNKNINDFKNKPFEKFC